MIESNEAKEAADKVVEILLALPWEQRSDACWLVRYNGIFCMECGTGERDSPRKICHCTNDE